jgi:hypothetical protein
MAGGIMNPSVKLYRVGTQEYGEVGAPDVTWVLDEYTEPRGSSFDCCACGDEIEEDTLWTCLDGGEAAHRQCVEIWVTQEARYV